MHTRVLPLLVLVVLAGCQTPLPPAPDLPDWAPDQAPQWVEGEWWRYSLEQGGNLTVTVQDARTTHNNTTVAVLLWHWEGQYLGIRQAHWRVLQRLDDLAWIHVDVLRADGSVRADQDLQQCPVLRVLPNGTRADPCVEQSGDFTTTSTLHRIDEGLRQVETGIGVLEGRHFRYSSDYGDPFNGTFAPAVGYWADMTMNAPADLAGVHPQRHVLAAYHNPRADVTLPAPESVGPTQAPGPTPTAG